MCPGDGQFRADWEFKCTTTTNTGINVPLVKLVAATANNQDTNELFRLQPTVRNWDFLVLGAGRGATHWPGDSHIRPGPERTLPCFRIWHDEWPICKRLIIETKAHRWPRWQRYLQPPQKNTTTKHQMKVHKFRAENCVENDWPPSITRGARKGAN